VAKTTLYRRWKNRDELLIEAVLSGVGGVTDVPETGSLEGDLTSLVREVVGRMQGSAGLAQVRLLLDFGTSGSSTPDLGRLRQQSATNAVLVQILDRWQKAGVVRRDIDSNSIGAMASSWALVRRASHEPLDDRFIDQLVGFMLRIVTER
jgi:AcrR family transcriptional regulator